MNNNYYMNKLAQLSSQLENLVQAYGDDQENTEHDPVAFGMMIQADRALENAYNWLSLDTECEAKA